jgi:hypothetical protein
MTRRNAVLMAYCVVVAMFATWPWNVWLLFFGTAYAESLQGRSILALLTTSLRQP